MKVPVANVYVDETDAKAAYDVVKTGWLSRGPETDNFEGEFKKYVGAKHAIAVNNGTSALHAALAALDIRKGDEVIVPSLTFISTANVVMYQGAKPVLAECDPKTYNITSEEIEKRITKNTKAVILVDMNGMPVDYGSIMDLLEERSLHVISDSAESLGAEYKDKKIGSIAPIHCFSFFPNKNVTTGEGGMITTNDDAIAERMRIITNQGQDGRYNHVCLGYNYRMNNIQAAIGRAQLKRIEWLLKEKERIVSRYNESLDGVEGITLPYVPNYVKRHAWYMYTISVDGSRDKRDKIVEKLASKGIETRLSFPPIHIQPFYRELFGYEPDSFPITYNAWSRLINIPIWPNMSEEMQDYVIRAVKESV